VLLRRTLAGECWSLLCAPLARCHVIGAPCAIREGLPVLEAAVDRLGHADLDRRPEDGGWTPREVVYHVADSETTSAI
jgi:hypothetical protein